MNSQRRHASFWPGESNEKRKPGRQLGGNGPPHIGLAKFGAHYNNYYNDPNNKGHLDSKDDQKSIGLGFDYWKDIQKINLNL